MSYLFLFIGFFSGVWSIGLLAAIIKVVLAGNGIRFTFAIIFAVSATLSAYCLLESGLLTLTVAP